MFVYVCLHVCVQTCMRLRVYMSIDAQIQIRVHTVDLHVIRHFRAMCVYMFREMCKYVYIYTLSFICFKCFVHISLLHIKTCKRKTWKKKRLFFKRDTRYHGWSLFNTWKRSRIKKKLNTCLDIYFCYISPSLVQISVFTTHTSHLHICTHPFNKYYIHI